MGVVPKFREQRVNAFKRNINGTTRSTLSPILSKRDLFGKLRPSSSSKSLLSVGSGYGKLSRSGSDLSTLSGSSGSHRSQDPEVIAILGRIPDQWEATKDRQWASMDSLYGMFEKNVSFATLARVAQFVQVMKSHQAKHRLSRA